MNVFVCSQQWAVKANSLTLERNSIEDLTKIDVQLGSFKWCPSRTSNGQDFYNTYQWHSAKQANSNVLELSIALSHQYEYMSEMAIKTCKYRVGYVRQTAERCGQFRTSISLKVWEPWCTEMHLYIDFFKWRTYYFVLNICKQHVNPSVAHTHYLIPLFILQVSRRDMYHNASYQTPTKVQF